MELIDQHVKKIMEECKVRARGAGLKFDDESLEYIVTNQDMLELRPKIMVPTLYDYWVHDLQVVGGKKEYELFPHNPYESVINSRPAISFYNDNNPDWMNVMIFYHVLGHIDFFQNNTFFSPTWNDDFVGKALADKRLIAGLRSEHGRWVDYIIEFTRGIDNFVAYHEELSSLYLPKDTVPSRLDFYFDTFLQKIKGESMQEYLKEVEKYNEALRENKEQAEPIFFSEVKTKYPEFDALFEKHKEEKKQKPKDLIQFLMENSSFLNNEENNWMKSVMQVVRDTAIYFAPQGRSKIIDEGWASYWHEKLFMADERINGHEVDYAAINATVTSLPRVGLNAYAVGMRLFQFIEEQADKGKLSYEFERTRDIETRKSFDKKTEAGMDFLFDVRENFNDFMFINTFVDQDFVDKHKLFVTGRRANFNDDVWEYYIKSRKAEDYKAMVLDTLAHPPHITIDEENTKDDGTLYLVHHFEGKRLVPELIPNTMIGIEYLWGKEVQLNTHELREGNPVEIIYTIKDKKLEKKDA